MAGGATRAALTQHQARRDNMADVSAKDGSQVSCELRNQMCTSIQQINITSIFAVSTHFNHPLTPRITMFHSLKSLTQHPL